MKALMMACALAALLAGPAAAADPLDVFKPFCGKTWRGEFTGGDGQAMTDVSRWELVLGGKAVRTVHSLNDGVTEVRSTWRLDDDGSFALGCEYLKGGQWVPGHSIRYVEAPGAEVVFR